MTNMSYCRFENTLEALQECSVELHENPNLVNELGSDEQKAAKRLLRLCRQLADKFGEEV